MFERLMLCDYAIADVTGANPNVYYELGIRHALRPRSTTIIFAQGTAMPFDVAPLRGIPYRLGEDGKPAQDAAASCISSIEQRLLQQREYLEDDSPLFQLVTDMPRIEIDHSKADTFREQFADAKIYKERLAAARNHGVAAVQALAADPKFADLAKLEGGITIELFLSLRDVEDFSGMIALYHRMPKPLQRTRSVQELYAFALNREKQSREAEQVLTAVLKEFGASSETYGLLGRVYKDRWEKEAASKSPAARALLRKAIDTYVFGFEADWRDSYPGVNAVSLMENLDTPDPRQAEILPVVRYAALHKAKRDDDYWSYATLLELAVIGNDRGAAEEWLGETLARALATAPWQIDATRQSLERLRNKRSEGGSWIAPLEDALREKRLELANAKSGSI
ncbi:MAG: DUF4071 domain-containing protein [Acidobacteria bacterium]|nr:DUF4071 domain-containing protein [Acidobacteriota bacterium]